MSVSDERVRTVGIIGAAAKGREIALHALLGGYRVILEDISARRLEEAQAQIAADLCAAAARKHSSVQPADEMIAYLCTTQSIDEVSRSADLLIEAAPDDPELQLEIFTIFDKFAKPTAVLASTARSISIADLAEITNCPERCVGLQFSDPLLSPDLSIRIVRAPKTSDRTLQVCESFARQAGIPAAVVSEPAGAVAMPGEERP